MRSGSGTESEVKQKREEASSLEESLSRETQAWVVHNLPGDSISGHDHPPQRRVFRFNLKMGFFIYFSAGFCLLSHLYTTIIIQSEA